MAKNSLERCNSEFFKDVSGKLIEFNPNKIYIIAMDISSSFVQIYVSSSLESTITYYLEKLYANISKLVIDI